MISTDYFRTEDTFRIFHCTLLELMPDIGKQQAARIHQEHQCETDIDIIRLGIPFGIFTHLWNAKDNIQTCFKHCHSYL